MSWKENKERNKRKDTKQQHKRKRNCHMNKREEAQREEKKKEEESHDDEEDESDDRRVSEKERSAHESERRTTQETSKRKRREEKEGESRVDHDRVREGDHELTRILYHASSEESDGERGGGCRTRRCKELSAPRPKEEGRGERSVRESECSRSSVSVHE
jgi:hypothetical protein